MAATPCSRPEAEPNDWYLDRHGQQYSDDPWLTTDQKEKLEAEMAERGLTRLQQISGIARIEAQLKREALSRRRRAKEDCYQCPIRTECLERALGRGETKGTWGGHFEEEIEILRRGIRRRRNRREQRAQEEQQSQVA